jgi:hypothetical protein
VPLRVYDAVAQQRGNMPQYQEIVKAAYKYENWKLMHPQGRLLPGYSDRNIQLIWSAVRSICEDVGKGGRLGTSPS